MMPDFFKEEELKIPTTFKEKMLKGILLILIKKFGFQNINDQLAAICFEKAESSKKTNWDDLSEAYDNINNYFGEFLRNQKS